MKKILTLFIILSSMNCSFGAAKHIMQNPYINNPYYHNQEYYMYKVLPKDLYALEKYALNKTYYRENPIQRLERLENLAFGSIQSGNIKNRYKNVETAILSRPKYTTKKSIVSNLADYFAGQATGLTPAWNYNNSHTTTDFGYFPANGFNNQSYNQYTNGGIFGEGAYNFLNNNTFNNGSLHILD